MFMKSKNALVHGVYASDIILPWEKAEEFHALLAGLRKEFRPNGVLENDIVFDMATLSWRKRRATRLMQLALVQNQFAAKIEDTGKRSVEGIRTELDDQRLKQERERKNLTRDVANLAEAMTSLRVELSRKKGRRWANLERTSDTYWGSSRSWSRPLVRRTRKGKTMKRLSIRAPASTLSQRASN
jgi:hypothetical protein